MSKFKVTLPGPSAPVAGMRRAIHPGLDLTTSRGEYRCRRCGYYFAVVEGTSFLGRCSCGLWTPDIHEKLRWIRFSSGPVEPGGKELYAP